MDFLEDQIEPIRFFEILDQLDDVLVSLTVMERFDLLEDPGATMTGNLKRKKLLNCCFTWRNFRQNCFVLPVTIKCSVDSVNNDM